MTQDPNSPFGGGIMGSFLTPQRMGLLGLSQGLLQAGGPSRMPVGFGSAVGQGMQGGIQGLVQGQQLQNQGIMSQLQMAKLKREMKAQEQWEAMYGGGQQSPAGATPPGMSPSTSMSAFGAPEFATVPQQPQTTGPTLQQIGILGGLNPAMGKFALEHYKTANPDPIVSGGYVVPRNAAPGTFLPTLRDLDLGGQINRVRTNPDGSDVSMGIHKKTGAPGTIDFNVSDLTPYGARDFTLNRARAGATAVTVDGRTENSYAQRAGSQQYDRDQGQHDAAMSAVEGLQKLDGIVNHLKTSDAITGMGSDILLQVERARALFTQSKKAGKTVSDTELLDSMLGSDVFPMIKALGVGARGMDTPAEREFLRNVMTGTTPMNKDTLIRMTEIRRDITERAIQKWNKRVENGELNRYFRALGTAPQKIELPRRTTSDDPLGLRGR
jgi:hypothetical protein